MKTCKKCSINKELTDFYIDKRSGLNQRRWATCISCIRIQQSNTIKNRTPEQKELVRIRNKKWQTDNFERIKFHNKNSVFKKFKITREFFESLALEQNYLCKICNKPETISPHNSKLIKVQDLSIDHCHETGKIRGLLCGNCNKALGHFKDSVEILQSAITYLKKSRE